jgi:AP-1 complex subunit mu
MLFEIPYHAASGMHVRYLKIVERSGYAALPWVRYVTQQGDYLIRMPEAVDSNAASALAAR